MLCQNDTNYSSSMVGRTTEVSLLEEIAIMVGAHQHLKLWWGVETLECFVQFSMLSSLQNFVFHISPLMKLSVNPLAQKF